MRATVVAAAGAALLVLLLADLVSAKPWNLPDFKTCSKVRMKGIKDNASGVTYSPVTNSLWVITRNPPVFAEYDMKGNLLRTISNANLGFRDPEGIEWMYDYTFAVSAEATWQGGPSGWKHSSVQIVELVPWRRSSTTVRRLVFNFPQNVNEGMESIAWDPIKQKLIGGQQEEPMQAWEIDPRTGRYSKILNSARVNGDLKNFAGMYKRVGDDGVYVLSAPSNYVAQLDGDGREVRGQNFHAAGMHMPEGLTFTPDGAMMVVVGEPNEMNIYSSVGTCNWSPQRATNNDTDTAAAPSPNPPPASPSKAPTEPLRTPGYCNWNSCKSGPPGPVWCRDNIDNCVGSCGGWWCSNTTGVPPITKDNYVAPSPPPAPPSPPRPLNSTSRPASPASWWEIPEQGYCNYNNCNGVVSGSNWCRQNVNNCVFCSGTWCPKNGQGIPMSKNNYVVRRPEPQNETDSEDSSFLDNAPDLEEGVLPDGDYAGDYSDDYSPPDALEVPEENTAEGTEDDLQKREEGYQALVKLVLSGVNNLNQTTAAILKVASANVTYGYKDAHVKISVGNSTLTRRLLSADGNSTGDEPTRKVDVIITLYGETEHHAYLLAEKLQGATDSGTFVMMLSDSGMPNISNVAFLSSEVSRAGMPPVLFPISPDVEVEEDVIVLEYEGSLTGRRSIAPVVIGASCGAGAALVAAVVGLALYLRRRRSLACSDTSASKGSDLPMKSMPSHDSGLQAEARLSIPSSNPVKEHVPAGGGKISHHQRNLSACALLEAVLDPSPSASPGHSRQSSWAMGDRLAASLAVALQAPAPQEGSTNV